MSDPQSPAAQTTAPPDGAGAEPEDDENVSLATEFIWFLRENKKWWLIPLVLAFAILVLLLFFGTNPATAPFIYSLV